MMSAVSRCKGFYLLLSLAILCNLSHGALPKLPGTALVQRFIKGRQADPRDHGADIASSEEDFHQATAPVLAEDIAEAIKPPRRRKRDVVRSRFGKIRAAVFPIENKECQKFFMMSGMMFFIIYVYTVVRDTKDTLIVSTCGAEAITFLKVYGVLPASALFMILYAKASNVLGKKALFYATSVPFFLFYAAFCTLIYPNRAHLMPHIDAQAGGLGFLVSLVKNWDYSLFYIVSELFGSVGVSVLFWQLANEIIKVHEAKRFYPLFGQLANIAPIAAGQTVVLSAHMTDPASKDPFLKSIQLITVFIMISGAAIMSLYRGITGLVEREDAAALAVGGETSASTTAVASKRKKKPKMSLAESFKFLLTNKYLGCMAILVVSYGLAINFTEVMWKSQVKLLYKDKRKYQQFMGNYSTMMGATTFIVIFFGSQIVKRFGMKVGALTTPAMLGLLAAPFFGYIVFGGISSTGASSPKALQTAVWVGLVQNILSKSIKYALFDPTKEMAYIPLGQEEKTKGKAAIDVLAARIGKSGGALLQQAIVLFFGNIIDGAPVVVGLFYIVIFAWLFAANSLGNQFEEVSKNK
ncbi:carrier protein [Nannochloropsis gaditana CCMP526]|nr:carrier protein [Nannochloropsis gaditana CCMP526]EKU20877.1 carrier protein [Nannochloropsis gaditana CCMP526]|eukprot:XP_005855475.1 carrier protein [Nannochloropsis gaditana CCMP526]